MVPSGFTVAHLSKQPKVCTQCTPFVNLYSYLTLLFHGGKFAHITRLPRMTLIKKSPCKLDVAFTVNKNIEIIIYKVQIQHNVFHILLLPFGADNT